MESFHSLHTARRSNQYVNDPLARRCALFSSITSSSEADLPEVKQDVVPPTFYFLWFRPWQDWGVAQALALDSIFLHHPEASLVFLSLQADVDIPLQFRRLTAMGYDIQGLHTTPQLLLEAGWYLLPEHSAWLSRISGSLNTSPVVMVHFAAYLKFYLLYKYGGTYVDTDVVFLRTLPEHAIIPWQNASSNGEMPPAILLRLPPSSPFALHVLQTAFKPSSGVYYADQVAEGLISDVMNGSSQLINLTYVVPSSFLDPSTSAAAHLLFQPESPTAFRHMYFQTTRKRAFSFVLHDAITRHMVALKESVVSFLAALSLSSGGTGCRLVGPTLLVATQVWTELTGSRAVAMSACAHVAEWKEFRVVVQAEGGLISLCGQAPTSQLVLNSLHTVREVNAALASLRVKMDDGINQGGINIALSAGTRIIGEKHIEVLVFNRMVTYLAHTNGRDAHIRALHASVQQQYPGTHVIASNDGVNASAGMLASPQEQTLQWVVLPEDSGLSVGRNELVNRATTPYVHILDDDFTVSEETNDDLLLALLHSSRFDIASPKIPADIQAGWNFRGLLAVENATMFLLQGSHGSLEGCEHVDFVPNVFLAKRAALLASPWEPALKLGEHEDFFMRAKASGLKVLFCPDTEVTHNQYAWWKHPDTSPGSYYGQRSRVFAFWNISLAKHDCNKLVVFGFQRLPLLPRKPRPVKTKPTPKARP
jgi:hypothetical protein